MNSGNITKRKKIHSLEKSAAQFYTCRFVVWALKLFLDVGFCQNLSTLYARDSRHWYELIFVWSIFLFQSFVIEIEIQFKREWPLGAINLFAIISLDLPLSFVNWCLINVIKIIPIQHVIHLHLTQTMKCLYARSLSVGYQPEMGFMNVNVWFNLFFIYPLLSQIKLNICCCCFLLIYSVV